jgi:hypothetical protein
MISIQATIKDRRLEVNVPDDWPDGTQVEIHPLGQSDDLPMTAEEIARTLAAMDQVEPLEMTDTEWAAWQAERQARKEWEKAHFAEHAEKLRRLWE